MRNIDSQSRPRTQFRFKYLAVRIRLLRLGGSLTTFSTVSAQSGHVTHCYECPLSAFDPKRTSAGLTSHPCLVFVLTVVFVGGDGAGRGHHVTLRYGEVAAPARAQPPARDPRI